MSLPEGYLELMRKFVEHKSISTDEAYQPQIKATAEWLKAVFAEHGFHSEAIEGYGNPVVFAEIVVDPSLETCLVYGHYDVQPATQEEGWQADPFQLQELPDKWVARGVVDDKGQIAMHMQTVFELLAAGKLRYNVKFMIEGEEESGSTNLPRFIREKAELLKADFILISDGEIEENQPKIEASLRGAVNIRVSVETSKNDFHSGLFGGAFPNAAQVLANLSAAMIGPDGKVTIPGFYDGVFPLPQHIVEYHQTRPYNEAELLAVTGTKQILHQPGLDYFTQVGLVPSVEITGINAGYNGPGYKNGVPGSAVLRMNVRTAPNQDPAVVYEHVKAWVTDQLPAYADCVIDHDPFAPGILIDTNNPHLRRAGTILEHVYGTKPIEAYCGATLPLLASINELGIPQVVIPLANLDSNMHGANENFRTNFLESAAAFSRQFFLADEQ